jgi:hypothetical protein
MSRRLRYSSLSALVVASCLTAAVCWASKIHESVPIQCPAVLANGQIDVAVKKTATLNLILDTSTGKFHGTAHVTVENASGKTHTFHDVDFGFPGVQKSTYTVHADGTAKVRLSGVEVPL